MAARMGRQTRFRPVDTPGTPPTPPAPLDPSPAGAGGERSTAAIPTSAWPAGAREQAEALHRLLTIGDRQWHALKSQRPRRAAEQLAGALVQLLAEDEPSRPAPTAARERAIDLLEHALAWLKAEVRDPGCPSHGR